MNDNIPTYLIDFDNTNINDKFLCISLVENAAVERDFLLFQQEQQNFTVTDKLKKHIMGVAIVANKKIYRYDERMGEFYVVFTPETIEKMVEQYSKDGLFNNVSVHHNGELVDDCILMQYFIKDSKKGLVPEGFSDVADGSLFVEYKINNDYVYNEILEGRCKGFSIEVITDIIPTNEQFEKQQPEDETELFIDELLNWLESEDIDFIFADSKKKVETIINEAIKDDKQLSIKLKDSSKTHFGWAYALFKYEGSSNVALWNGNDWELINLSNIEKINTTNSTIQIQWSVALQHPNFDWIHKQVVDSEQVKETAVAKQGFFENVIMNHKVCMIKYNDEDGRCESYRQVLICQMGYTTANNLALKVYQYSGASHNVLDGTGDIPDWRVMLVSRILDVKEAPYFEPVNEPPQGFNPFQDRDGFMNILKAKW